MKTEKTTRMRKIKEGEKMPDDFWNYLVNPITGYYIQANWEHSIAMEKKYNKATQAI